MTLEVKVGREIDVSANINVSPILIHLNQKEIKYMIVLADKLSQLSSNKPKHRPTDKRSVVYWWRYIVSRVYETENIKSQVHITSLHTYVSE